MIERGSSDEAEAKRHIGMYQAMLKHWNEEADRYREAARGNSPAASYLLEEADRTRDDIHKALDTCDTLADNIGPGHPLLSDIYRLEMSFESLSGSIAVSIDRLAPRVRAENDIAGLKYLVSALKRDARLDA